MTSQVYVTAVDCTGAEPDYFAIPRRTDPDTHMSIEIIAYEKIVPDIITDQMLVSELIYGSHQCLTCINWPITSIHNRHSNNLRRRLELMLRLRMPFTMDGARWSPDLSLTSHEPLEDMAARLLNKADLIRRLQKRRPLRMAVFICKLTVVSSPIFALAGPLLTSLGHTFMFRVVIAAREAAGKNAPPAVRVLKAAIFEGSDRDSKPVMCSICLEDLSTGSLVAHIPCFHDFHAHCLRKWMQWKNTCPFCRSDLS